MNQLSVVLATHNEVFNLAKCLDAVKNIANEVIVVDGNSTDGTVKIAHQYKAKVVQTENRSNFHINKQMAIDQARYRLILQLDADEVVDDELAKFIKKLKTIDLSDAPAAWYLKRKNYFLGRFLTKGGQYPDPVIRLFQKGQAKLPQKDVHEQMQVTGQVATAPGHLLHYSYPNFGVYLTKFNTYTSFAASSLVKEGFTPGFSSAIKYFVIKPANTFASIFFRHKGLVDGIPGLIFATMSAWHHPIVYLKAVELLYQHENTS